MGPFGITEILLLLVVIVILFGAKRIPELAKGLGSGIKEFKGALHSDEKDKIEEAKK